MYCEERRHLFSCCVEGSNRNFCFISPAKHPRSSVSNLPRLFLTAAGASSAVIRRIRSIHGSLFSGRERLRAPSKNPFSRQQARASSRCLKQARSCTRKGARAGQGQQNSGKSVPRARGCGDPLLTRLFANRLAPNGPAWRATSARATSRSRSSGRPRVAPGRSRRPDCARRLLALGGLPHQS